MNKRRFQRAVLFAGIVGLLLIGACALWVRTQRHKDALDGQLIAALVKRDDQQALVLVNSGADPNTPCHPVPPPSLRQLWNYLLRRSPLPKTGNPTALLIACGASPTFDDGTPMLRQAVGPPSTADGGSPSLMSDPERPRLVEAMIQHGGNINARDQDKYTPLMWAAMSKYPKTVGVLLEHKASVNAQVAYGSTALYLAVEYAHSNDLTSTDIVRQLLAHGANPNLSDHYGITPLQEAQQYKRPDLVALMRRVEAQK